MAKTVQDVAKSRAARQVLLEKYEGEIPSSVWVANVADDGGIIQYEAKARKQTYKRVAKLVKERNSDSAETKFLLELCGKSGYSARAAESFSIMPANIVRRVIAFYSEPGDTVLDPCAGHNSRMQVTHEQGRNYIGYDVCHWFMEFNREVAGKIQKRDTRAFFGGECDIILREQSSEHLEEGDCSVDLVFTSPPYWDLEHYDDHPEQLGIGKTYEQFLDGLQRVAAECFRVLKPGKFCVFNVNDFRKDGRLYLYHADTLDRFQRAGFEPFDVIIMLWPSIPFRSIFATQVERDKKTGKAHEYLLVFRKQK